MAVKSKQEAQNPLILRSHRLMEVFAKSDDERDFYLDRLEGFIIYVDLDKHPQEIETLEKELIKNSDRYCPIPKLTFYETKKIMEGFVNEKVYDIDTKEKLLDIIQSKDARTNFLEFIYDHHAELEKWQQYYQERSRIRIIEWLRTNHFHFVFEEDLELSRGLIEKLKQNLFQSRVGKDILTSRKMLVAKAKTYYSNEALNPRPKRGRPPKQVAKQEIEPQITTDIYTTVPPAVKPFLFTPEITSSAAVTFSAKFENTDQFLARRTQSFLESDTNVENLNQKLALLRNLSTRWVPKGEQQSESAEEEYDDDEKPRKNQNKPKHSLSIKKKNAKRSILPKSKKPVEKLSVAKTKRLRPQIKTKDTGKLTGSRPKRIIPTVKTSLKKETSIVMKSKPILAQKKPFQTSKNTTKAVISKKVNSRPKKSEIVNTKQKLKPPLKRILSAKPASNSIKAKQSLKSTAKSIKKTSIKGKK